MIPEKKPTKVVYHIDTDRVYNDYLSEIKELIPRLGNPLHVYLCSVWIERFAQCQRHEKDARNELIKLMANQLHSTNELQFPFNTFNNANRPLADIIYHSSGRVQGMPPSMECADNCTSYNHINTQITNLNKHIGEITHMNEGLQQECMTQNIKHKQKNIRLKNTWAESIEQYQTLSEKYEKQIDYLKAVTSMYQSKNKLLTDLLMQQNNELAAVHQETVELRKVNERLLCIEQIHYDQVCGAFAEWDKYLCVIKHSPNPREQLKKSVFTNKYADRLRIDPETKSRLQQHEQNIQLHLFELASTQNRGDERIFHNISKDLDENKAKIKHLEVLINRSVVSTESQTTDEYLTADSCNDCHANENDKYKRFVKKCVKEIKFLKEQQLDNEMKIKHLQRDSHLKDNNNAIRYAALKTELNIQLGDKHCKDLDNLHHSFENKLKDFFVDHLNKNDNVLE